MNNAFESGTEIVRKNLYGYHLYNRYNDELRPWADSETSYKSFPIFRFGRLRMIFPNSSISHGEQELDFNSLAAYELLDEDKPSVKQACDIIAGVGGNDGKARFFTVVIDPTKCFDHSLSYHNSSFNSSTARSTINTESTNLIFWEPIIYFV